MDWATEELLVYVAKRQNIGRVLGDKTLPIAYSKLPFLAKRALEIMNDRHECKMLGADYLRMNIDDRNIIYRFVYDNLSEMLEPVGSRHPTFGMRSPRVR